MESYSQREAMELLRRQTNAPILDLCDRVWEQKDAFIKWPMQADLLWPGLQRPKGKLTESYPDNVWKQLKNKGLKLQNDSNGLATLAFRYFGGDIPNRAIFTPKGNYKKWSVHHIYNGHHPYPGRSTTLHAVQDGNHFTHSGGLVAVHPIADTIADECAYMAWLLRLEAFKRFKYDPDNVFCEICNKK